MEDRPVAWIKLDSHNNDGVGNGSTQSSKTASNRSVVIAPNQK